MPLFKFLFKFDSRHFMSIPRCFKSVRNLNADILYITFTNIYIDRLHSADPVSHEHYCRILGRAFSLHSCIRTALLCFCAVICHAALLCSLRARTRVGMKMPFYIFAKFRFRENNPNISFLRKSFTYLFPRK